MFENQTPLFFNKIASIVAPVKYAPLLAIKLSATDNHVFAKPQRTGFNTQIPGW
jgi:hypothetical protein